MSVAYSVVSLGPAIASSNGSGADPTLWYITRAAGVSAYVLLAVVVDLGILRSLARQLGERVSWVLDEVHQFLALLAAAFVALHLGVLLFDPFITFSVVNLLLPIGEPYQSLGVGLGVLGLYALIVVLISSWLRRYISHRLWRALHYGSFGVFILVTLHGLLSGSDSGLGWLRSVYFAALASMLFLTVMRLAMPVGGVRANR
jgi:methionine sulfoxide reductase heme-binding subunit